MPGFEYRTVQAAVWYATGWKLCALDVAFGDRITDFLVRSEGGSKWHEVDLLDRDMVCDCVNAAIRRKERRVSGADMSDHYRCRHEMGALILLGRRLAGALVKIKRNEK